MIHGYGCLASNACQQFLPYGYLVIQLFSVWCASSHIHLDSASPSFCHGTNESVSNGVSLPSNCFIFSGGWVPKRTVLLAHKGAAVLLPDCPEEVWRNSHDSQKWIFRKVKFRIDKAKGKGTLFSRWQCGLAWRSTTNSCMYLQCFILIPLTALTWDFILSILVPFVKCSLKI